MSTDWGIFFVSVMSTKVSSFELQQLKVKVYQAARDGRAISIFAMLWNLDRQTVVNEVRNLVVSFRRILTIFNIYRTVVSDPRTDLVNNIQCSTCLRKVCFYLSTHLSFINLDILFLLTRDPIGHKRLTLESPWGKPKYNFLGFMTGGPPCCLKIRLWLIFQNIDVFKDWFKPM